MLLHGYFKLAAAEIWGKTCQIYTVHLNLSLLFAITDSYNSTRFVRREICQGVLTSIAANGGCLISISQQGDVVDVMTCCKNLAAAPHWTSCPDFHG